MADDRPTLVVHLVSGEGPLLFPLRPDHAEELGKRLHLCLEHGSVESVETAQNITVHLNFAQVAVAYLDPQRTGKPFGLR